MCVCLQLTRLYQERDIIQLNQRLSKCLNATASLQYIDRAHDQFTKVYSHASLGNYHDMMKAFVRFRQPLRVDEYFRVMLRYHAPTRTTYHYMLQLHAIMGHTAKVQEILKHMQEGSMDLVADQLPEALRPKAGEPATTEEDKVIDPAQRPSAEAKRLAANASARYPVGEKHLHHLLRCHAVNNDTEPLLALVHQMEDAKGEGLFPLQAGPLRLTLPTAEMLMHYYSQQRLLGECVRLMRWCAREFPSSMPMSSTLAWHFFDAFKRQVAWEQLQRQANDAGDKFHGEAQRLITEEAAVRARKEPATAPTVATTTPPPVPAIPPIAHKWTSPALREHFPIALARAAQHVRNHPFPAAINSTSLPASLSSSYPASPIRAVVRSVRPTPLDIAKEDVDVIDAIKIMAFGSSTPSGEAQAFAGGFLPGAKLVDSYVSYFLENFFPVRHFPDVMWLQVRAIEDAFGAVKNAEGPNTGIFRPLLETPEAVARREALPANHVREEEVVALHPFQATARTFALAIRAHLVREPLLASSPDALALRTHRGGRVGGPSDADLSFVQHARSLMRSRGVATTLLQTKVDMMVVMAYREQWAELYAAFTLLWKAEKLRAHKADIERARGSTETTPAAADAAEESAAGEDGEDASAAASSFGSSTAGSEPFTCMSLLPVIMALGQRVTLDRLNLFLAVLTSARDFPLTRPFFQVLLSVLADRGATADILKLLKLMASPRYGLPLRTDQYNALLASVVRRDPKALAPAVPDAEGNLPAVTPKQQRLVTIYQVWELLKLLKVQANGQTMYLLMTGVLHYGELVDGRRMWGWIMLHQPRPSMGLYTVWIEFLLKQGELGRALHALRSLSLKEGHDWTLKQCYMLIDYLKANLLRHARKTPAPAEGETGAPSTLTDEQAAAVYVPTAEQQALYADILSRCDALQLALLRYEKRGGRLGQRGITAAVLAPGSESNALSNHRDYFDPLYRATNVSSAMKEADSVASHSFIPARLFQTHMAPLLRLVDQFADTATPSFMRAQDRKQHMQMLLEAALEPTALAATSASVVEQDTGERELSLAEQGELSEAIDTLEMQEETPAADEGEAALDVEEQLEQSSAETVPEAQADLLLDSLAARVDETDPEAAAVQAQQQQAKYELASDKEAASAARTLGISIEHKDKQPKAKRAAKTQSKEVEGDAPKAKEARAPTAPTPAPELPPPATPAHAACVESVKAALQELASRATRTRALQAPLPLPPAHPVMLDGVDLCAARSAATLNQLSIDQLKSVQLKLMQQPQTLVKGIRSHHIGVVDAWLRHCECCKGSHKQ